MKLNTNAVLESAYYRYSGILYCVFILLLYLFTKSYAVEAKSLKVILLCLYFIFSALFQYGMFKSQGEEPNMISALILPIIMLPMLLKPILLIPIVGVIVLYFKFKSWRIIGSFALVFFIFAYSIFGFISLLTSAFSGIVEITIVNEIASPNGQYKLVVRESDEGALGGSVSVLVEKNLSRKEFIGIVRRKTDSETDRRRLYYGHWGERPSLLWVDDKTAKINGREFNIFTDKEWDDK